MTYYVSIGTLNLTKPNQRDQTACAILSLSCWKLNNLFSTIQPLSICELAVDLQLSEVWCSRTKVTSLITCIQFRLCIKEYLTNWHKFCIDC